jgi:hypothetical protein
MLIVPGPEKVDLIFEDVPHAAEPPWTVTSTTLEAVDAHFWDWTLRLASKVDASKAEVVDAELGKMHEHLLGPLESGAADLAGSRRGPLPAGSRQVGGATRRPRGWVSAGSSAADRRQRPITPARSRRLARYGSHTAVS